MVSSMNNEKKLGSDNQPKQIQKRQTRLDILKVLEQCGIQFDSLEQYLQKIEKMNNCP